MQDKLQDFYYRQANRNIVHHFGDVHFQSITCSVTDKQVTCCISQGIVKKVLELVEIPLPFCCESIGY